MPLRLDERQLAALTRHTVAPKRPKYGNTRTPAAGVTLDSKLEARYYGVLLMRERSGEIRWLRRQVDFPLVVNGQLVCTFRADFVFEEREAVAALWGQDWRWREVVADCKSEPTRRKRDYRIKFKLLRALHGIEVREVLDKDV